MPEKEHPINSSKAKQEEKRATFERFGPETGSSTKLLSNASVKKQVKLRI
jgi:hypothetical protein